MKIEGQSDMVLLVFIIVICGIGLWYLVNPADFNSIYRKPKVCDECKGIYFNKICNHSLQPSKSYMLKFVLFFTLTVLLVGALITQPVIDYSFFVLDTSNGVGKFINALLCFAFFGLMANQLPPWKNR